MSDVSTCANCQAAIKATARFCVGCGHRVGDSVQVAEAAVSGDTAPTMPMVATAEPVPSAVTELSKPTNAGVPPLPSEAAAEPAWSPPVIPVRSQSLQPNDGSAKKRGPLLIAGGVVAALLLGGGGVALTKNKSSSVSAETVVSADSISPITETASTFVTTKPPAADTTSPVPQTEPTRETVPAAAVVPDIIGSSEPSAKSAIVNVRLTPQINYDYSATIPKGYVVRQNPPPGRDLAAGQTVELVVSNGPTPQSTAPTPTLAESDSNVYEAIVEGTNGVDNVTNRTGEGYLSVRSAPRASSTELRRIDESETVRFSCQVSGNMATSAKYGESAVWAKLAGGEYVAMVYLEAGISRIKVTIPC